MGGGGVYSIGLAIPENICIINYFNHFRMVYKYLTCSKIITFLHLDLIPDGFSHPLAICYAQCFCLVFFFSCFVVVFCLFVFSTL